MDATNVNAVRRLLKLHKPVHQEGIPYVMDGKERTMPILCRCGEVGQSYWNDVSVWQGDIASALVDAFTWSAWLDHFQVVCYDDEGPVD